MGNGIADLYLNRSLDTRNDISYASARNLLARVHLHLQHSDLVSHILLAGADELDLVTRLDGTVHHLEISDDAAERVEHRVENQRLERCIRITLRCRNPLHDSVKHLLHALAGLS